MNKKQDSQLKRVLMKKEELHITEILGMFLDSDKSEILEYLENSPDYESSYGGIGGCFYRLSWDYKIQMFVKQFTEKRLEELYQLFMKEYERFPYEIGNFKRILLNRIFSEGKVKSCEESGIPNKR
jgi:hypothetical protein